MTSPIISVVIPVYNAEKYLKRCINSVLHQSFNDFELILVDDGSSDQSYEICKQYAEKDMRARVIHKSNGGVSSARNRGIEDAKGKYICFVDSDDWLEPSYLQNFMEVEPSKHGVVLQSFFFDYEYSGITIPIILPDKKIEKASELEYFLEYADGVHNGFLWHRLFHLDIIKEYYIRYPENVSFAEDGIFFLNYISYTNNFAITSNAGYHYLLRSNSLTCKGKTLPLDTYCYLLVSFAEPTQRIIDNDMPNEKIEQGLRRYMWRLASDWICYRSIHNYQDYMAAMQFWRDYSTKFRIDLTVKEKSFLFRCIQHAMSRKATRMNYFRLWLAIRGYSLYNRLATKLRNILNQGHKK